MLRGQLLNTPIVGVSELERSPPIHWHPLPQLTRLGVGRMHVIYGGRA